MLGSNRIQPVASGEEGAEWMTGRVDHGVDLGAEPAPRVPDRLLFAVFFEGPQRAYSLSVSAVT